jgi:alkylhydroperoxidase family enzyme
VTWIRTIAETEAEGAVRDAYAGAGAARGRVSNILKVHGVHPEVLTAHLRLYVEVMFGRSELTRAERETMAVAVSVANGCHY